MRKDIPRGVRSRGRKTLPAGFATPSRSSRASRARPAKFAFAFSYIGAHHEGKLCSPPRAHPERQWGSVRKQGGVCAIR